MIWEDYKENEKTLNKQTNPRKIRIVEARKYLNVSIIKIYFKLTKQIDK